ncbi:hypothetical protein LY28_01307 [Ruminiclostridium sufflavum DSM 19573]|uniref:Adhesin n=1 Tax=Ruminiclostridium sufflavum DSM 19573 TaxID=1121337 RepID=A0A318XLF6_9FIRM|nr:hypothetical protein [Ruminiclostridium sufflavum]PYG88458.1 hypothetical protein LY28_01307 [Ruminiclostridium sufflavum DSM 19573]
MKRVILCILFIPLICLSGCKGKSSAVPKHGAAMYNDLPIALSSGIKTLDITIDSGNLQIYCWDKKIIKSEAKHIVRDNKTDEELEKMLRKYSVEKKEKENTLFYKINYSGSINNPKDIYTDINLTIPKQIKNIHISQQYGSIALMDKFEGNIEADLDSVNSVIKYMKGFLAYECDKGTLRLDLGKLENQSFVNISSGNIYIKSQYQNKSAYSFKTKKGNIDLLFPKDLKVKLNSFGAIDSNGIIENEGDIEVEAYADMGKISINGY